MTAQPPEPAETSGAHTYDWLGSGQSFLEAWLGSGQSFLEAQLRAIHSATACLWIETYIFTDSQTGRQFLNALVDAARRGVAVELLVDRFGSGSLPDDYFEPLLRAGGRQAWFNPPRPGRWTLRDHRKILLVDGATVFVGGCNISDEYAGDGVTRGWRDGGVRITGPVVQAIAQECREQWARAHQNTWRLVRGGYCRTIGSHAEVTALFIKPGLGLNPLRRWLREDLKHAKNVAITAAYFLPTRRLRSQLIQADKRGARVRLLLPGISDIPLLARATRSLHRGLQRGGIELFEYMPQVLHAKALVLDDIVYIGSANLDPRSLRINFEIMLRIKNAALAREALAQFEQDLTHSRAVTPAAIGGLHALGRWLLEKLAWFIFARLDPWIARGQLRRHKRPQHP
ncbi:MAG: phosphatidylserine/phosphatidylglycerophosphate/cardiolipin synthase family protein [Opitutaceae bacterium]|nr:phosphatidylserine/phosphatidylglycerophosphate/cardiolipin synthase family protein [Opitutaceae bacterium]